MTSHVRKFCAGRRHPDGQPVTPNITSKKAQGRGALRHGAATGVQVIPLPAVLAEVADVFPCQEPADHGRGGEQLKIGMAAQDGCSKYYLLYCTIVCIGQNITLMTYS
jgi:hypothetical protein